MDESKPKLIPNYFRRSDIPFARKAPTKATKTFWRIALVIGGLALSLLLIVPAFPESKGKYHAAHYRCAANMKMLVLAVSCYSYEHNSKLPGSYTDLAMDRTVRPHLFICPGNHTVPYKSERFKSREEAQSFLKSSSYFYCGDQLDFQTKYGNESDIVTLYESPREHDSKRLIIGFLDGHVEIFEWGREAKEDRAVAIMMHDAQRGVRPVRLQRP